MRMAKSHNGAPSRLATPRNASGRRRLKRNILSSYLAKELLLYFVVSFAFFFVVFFVNQILLLAETVLRKRVPLSDVVRLIVYRLPNIISQSAPFATLVGFLMCLGRLVTENEILILRAAGQRYGLILKVVLKVGLGISVFSFIMNDYFLPIGTIAYNRLFRQIILSNPAVELETNAVKRMNDATLVIGDTDGARVSDIVLLDFDDEGNRRIIVSGASEVSSPQGNLAGILMQLHMTDSVVTTLDAENTMQLENYEVVDADNLTLNIFDESIIAPGGGTSPREMTSWDVMRRFREMKRDEDTNPHILSFYDVELNKKFSLPFASFFFALLAVPLALMFGKSGGQAFGLIFGILLSVAYWAANIIGQMFGIRSGLSGFWMMWTPNLVLGLVGIILYFRLRKN